MFSPSKRIAALAFAASVAAIAPLSACAAQPAPAVAPAAVRLEPLDLVTAKGPVKLRVELADDEAKRMEGLMFRPALAPDRGMLFDFKTERPVAFWMRNTLIPLDMVFIKADGRILSIARNARPHDETPIPSGGAVRAVLEIPGGRAAELGLLPGDRVRHRIFPAR